VGYPPRHSERQQGKQRACEVVENTTPNSLVLKANRRPELPQPNKASSLNLPKGKGNEINIKEKSATPVKKEKAATIIFMGGRIYKLESESINMNN
jgi:hypothetical protein